MAIWLFRAGKSGEYENKFLDDNRIYLTWEELNTDLSKLSDRKVLLEYLLELYSNFKPNTVRNWLGQIYPMAHRINKGDWIILPSKQKAAIHIGEVKGDYEFHKNATDPFYHSREINWFATDIPRSEFDQDLLYSFGAFMTVCQIKRNNAEERIKRMQQNNWTIKKTDILSEQEDISANDDSIDFTQFDLEQYSNDQIGKLIIRKFKGHRMESLIESILNAKGYTTYHSPKGADNGIDIMAAMEPMGFGEPRLCVQVKTSDTPIDTDTLDRLVGTIHNYGADHGLLVSWSGFKSSIEKVRSKQFFKVRLWGQKEIIQELKANYDNISDEIKAEIPLKKIWSLSISDEE